MSRTKRKYERKNRHIKFKFNPYWYKKELKRVRINLIRSTRVKNRGIMSKIKTGEEDYRDLHNFPRTKGWESW